MELTESNLHAQIAEFFEKSIQDITSETLLKDLVQDSFVLVELVMGLQEDFNARIMQEDLKDVDSVGKLINAFMSKA
jgi:acyl carrier protein